MLMGRNDFFLDLVYWIGNKTVVLSRKIETTQRNHDMAGTKWFMNKICYLKEEQLLLGSGAENVRTDEWGSGEILADQGKFWSTIKKLKINGNFYSPGEVFITPK